MLPYRGGEYLNMKKLKPQKQIRLQHYHLIQRILSDEAEITGLSDSQIIENILLEHFLPQRYRATTIDLYTDCLSIGDALVRIWAEAADLRHGDMRELVEYARMETIRANTHPTTESEELPHLLSLLDSLSLYIKDDKNKRWLDQLIAMYEGDPGPIVLCNLYDILLGDWDCIKNYVKTYNLLQTMAYMQPSWITTPESRKELVKILKKLDRK